MFRMCGAVSVLFSEMQKDKTKMLLSYEKIIHFLAYISFPLSVFFFTAREITLIIFGGQWLSVPFSYLSVTVGLQILLNTSGALFRLGMIHGLCLYAAYSRPYPVSAIYVGVFGFGWSVAVFMSIAVVLNFLSVILRCIK
ncbi:MAG: oligosaccharide flippase family protein [Barnesiella sp.]